MFSEKKTSYSHLVRSIFVPVVLGLAAGIAGAMIVQAYVAALSASTIEPLQIGRLPSSSVSSAQLLQVELAARLHRMDVPLYPRRVNAGAELAQRGRSVSEAVGYATVITSDGWLVTSASVLNGPVSAGVGGRLLEPQKQIADPRTGLVFLKVDASALPVTGFEETAALRQGSSLYALDENGLFAVSAFGGTTPMDRRASVPNLQNADHFTLAYRTARAWGLRAAGGAALSADGDLAGILVPDKTNGNLFVPTHQFRHVLAQIFRGETPARATLGVSYLTLDETAFSESGFGSLKGARLTGSSAFGIPAVRPGSAAAKAGLREGDILLRVDGVELSGGRDLGEVIAEAGPGSKIRFDVLKEGTERTVDVTLDSEKR